MDLSATTMIDVPAEEADRLGSDPANDVRWRTGVAESGLTTDPPLALGSEGYVKAGNRVARWKVTALTAGASVDWDLTEGPYAGSGGYRLEDMDGRTRFTLVADVEPRASSGFSGPSSPGWVGNRTKLTLRL